MAKRMTKEEREDEAEVKALARFFIEHKNMREVKEIMRILKQMEEAEWLAELERFGVTVL